MSHLRHLLDPHSMTYSNTDVKSHLAGGDLNSFSLPPLPMGRSGGEGEDPTLPSFSFPLPRPFSHAPAPFQSSPSPFPRPLFPLSPFPPPSFLPSLYGGRGDLNILPPPPPSLLPLFTSLLSNQHWIDTECVYKVYIVMTSSLCQLMSSPTS